MTKIRKTFSPETSAREFRRAGGERFFNHNGILNASSKKDAMEALAVLTSMVQNEQVTMESPEEIEERQNKAEEKKEAIKAAYLGNDSSWLEVGAAIGAKVSTVADREGFMRNFMVNGDITQGNIPRIKVIIKNVEAQLASGPSKIQPQLVRDNYLYPPEFYVFASIFVEEREMVQGGADVMDDAYNKALEQIMITEDRTWKRLADATVGVENNQVALSGGLTPSTLASMRSDIARWNIAPTSILMASDLWSDIVGNAASFSNLFDPVSQFEIIQTGRLGTLLGLDIRTDAFRHPNLQVLQSGDFYIIGSPEMHGVYTDRGPVTANELSAAIEKTPGRGWFLHELLSIVLHNPRSLVKGVRS